MTKLLIRLFVKDNKNIKDVAVRTKYASLSSFTGIFLNVLLFIGKLLIGIISNSVSAIADAFNNLTDAGSSVVTLIGFRLSSKPVDTEHPHGHGRFEYVAAFIVDMIILVVGFELFTASIGEIIHPTATKAGITSLILLGVAVLIKLWLFFFYRKIANTISSSAIKAAATDSISDCLATTLVFVTVLLSYFNVATTVPIDGIVGILVAVFILYSGAKAAKETIDLLLGATPSKEFIEDIYSFVKGYPELLGIHDVMVHDYGPGRQIVSFHAEVSSDCDINHAHEVIDQLERDMHAKFNYIVTIHLDPISVNDEHVNAMREFAKRCVKEISPEFSIHDFRITKGDNYTNLIFDLVIPHDSKISVDAAVKLVGDKIRAEDKNCYAVIRGEHPYV
ncbi:MAG: cation transporter [Clostridia bacterium]|nr:cation transporter [Clostridia bacterium]